MRIKSFSILLFTLILGSLSVHAQFDQLAQYNKMLMQNWSGSYIRVGSYKVGGSPYLYGEAIPGEIMVAGENQYNKLNILYNIYDQKVGILVNNEFTEVDKGVTSFLIHTPQKFGANILKFDDVSYFNAGKLKGFFNILAEKTGKYSFLRYFSAKLIPDPENVMDKDVKIFDQDVTYYIFNNQTKELKKVKLRAKDIESAISEAKANNKGNDLSTVNGVVNFINNL